MVQASREQDLLVAAGLQAMQIDFHLVGKELVERQAWLQETFVR